MEENIQNMALGVDKCAKFNDIYLDLPKMVQIYYFGWCIVHHLIRQEGGKEARAASNDVGALPGCGQSSEPYGPRVTDEWMEETEGDGGCGWSKETKGP